MIMAGHHKEKTNVTNHDHLRCRHDPAQSRAGSKAARTQNECFQSLITMMMILTNSPRRILAQEQDLPPVTVWRRRFGTHFCV